MATTISTITKNLILDTLGDSTTGVIRIWIYDDSSTIIGSEQTITWSAASSGNMAMSDTSIVFNVPSSTIVSGAVLSYYSESMTTGITETFDEAYTFTNAGTFTVVSIVLTAL